jgi:hypothetical protein
MLAFVSKNRNDYVAFAGGSGDFQSGTAGCA